MEDLHVGKKIEELLKRQHKTKKQLGDEMGMPQGNVVYLTKRASTDVKTLHAVGNALKYNFWNHFPIDDGTGNAGKVTDKEKQITEAKDKEIAKLNAKVAEQEKVIEGLRQDLVKQENDFLREINGLLKKKG